MSAALLRIRSQIDSVSAPHHVATDVLLWSGVSRPPVPINKIARRLGVKVLVCGINSASMVDSTGPIPMIKINEQDPLERQRFSLAHQLGHLLLHPLGTVRTDTSYVPLRDKIEDDANEFAASLLVPLWMLEPVVTSATRWTSNQLAKLFCVSQNTLAFQIRKLS